MKVIIVGAGLMGLTTAYFLARNGIDVTVIERRRHVALETSYANGGLLTPSLSSPWNTPGILKTLLRSICKKDSSVLFCLHALPSLLTWGIKFIRESKPKNYWQNTIHNTLLTQYNLSVLSELCQKHNLDFCHNHGSIMIFRDGQAFASTQKQLQTLSSYGITYQPLTHTEIADREPMLKAISAQLVGGLFCPDDEFGDAYQFCLALFKITQKLGVKYRFNSEVESVKFNESIMTSVSIEDTTFTADGYVFSAGSYTSKLLKSIYPSLPIKPVKGYSISVPLLNKQLLPKYSILDYDHHAALTPLGDMMRVTGTAEFAGFNTRIDPKRINNLIHLLYRVYPRYKNQQLNIGKVNAWAGLRPTTPDGVPIISRSNKLKNVFINSGQGHLGWSMAVGSAKLLTDIILDQKPDLDVVPYQIDRFY